MGEPGGLPSMGSHRVRHDRRDLAAAAAECQRVILPFCSPLSQVQRRAGLRGVVWGRKQFAKFNPALNMTVAYAQWGRECR